MSPEHSFHSIKRIIFQRCTRSTEARAVMIPYLSAHVSCLAVLDMLCSHQLKIVFEWPPRGVTFLPLIHICSTGFSFNIQVAVSGQITPKPCAILSIRVLLYTVLASSDVPSFLGSVIRLQSIHLCRVIHAAH